MWGLSLSRLRIEISCWWNFNIISYNMKIPHIPRKLQTRFTQLDCVYVEFNVSLKNQERYINAKSLKAFVDLGTMPLGKLR